MKSTTGVGTISQEIQSQAQNLEVRYGEIGISAVAAAMRYKGDSKRAAPASVDKWLEERFAEIAA
jgi:hypothetical protein